VVDLSVRHPDPERQTHESRAHVIGDGEFSNEPAVAATGGQGVEQPVVKDTADPAPLEFLDQPAALVRRR
jgi:hypothetical protein